MANRPLTFAASCLLALTTPGCPSDAVPTTTEDGDAAPADATEDGDAAPADATEDGDAAPADATEDGDAAPADATEDGDAAPADADATEDGDAAPADADGPEDTEAPSEPRPIALTVFMHSEDPYHPHTPDFTAAGPASEKAFRSYVGFRRVLLAFARRMDAAGLPWDLQPDWNLTRGVLKYEVESYTAPVAPDLPTVAALLAESGGKNLYRHLAEDLGVTFDPHSHENGPMGGEAYNYADVACLIAATGVAPSGIVGGHTIESGSGTLPAEWQRWPRFKAPLAGSAAHAGEAHVGPSCSWTATALMGGGTPGHVDETAASGVWLPREPPGWETATVAASASFRSWYFQIDPASTLPAMGSWEAGDLATLEAGLASGGLDAAGLWNATQVVNHSALAEAAYGSLSGTDKWVTNLDTFASNTDAGVGPEQAAQDFFDTTIAPLVAMAETSRVRFMTFPEVLALWRSTFSGRSNLCIGDAGGCVTVR